MLNFREKLLATKASSDRNRQQDLDILKVKLEEKKLHIEWWKLAVSILAPILAAGIAAGIATYSINKQLATQTRLKQDEFDFQQRMETQKYESDLLFNALMKNDGDSLFRKLVLTGFLNDTHKRYSFLLYDTVYTIKPYVIDIADNVSLLQVKNISRWDKDYMFDIFGIVQASHPDVEIDNSGMIKFSLDISSIQETDFRPILALKDSLGLKKIARIEMPLISVPYLSRTKRVIFKTYDRRIKENFNDVYWVDTEWNLE